MILEERSQTEIFKRELPQDFQFSLVSYGVNLRIRTNNARVFDRIRDYLPPGWQSASFPVADESYSLIIGDRSEGVRYQLYREREKLLETAILEEMLDIFNSDLRLQVAIAVKDKLFVHAGVVAWQDKAIVIPGRSFSGKTTLVAALVKAGAIYYSDEYAVFDTDGLVHPYPRPLSVRQAGGMRVRCAIEELGGTAGTKPLSVGLIVHAQYEAGVEWKPVAMSKGQAVLALLDNTVVARTRPQFALSVLPRTVSNAFGIAGKRGEAAEVAEALLRQLSDRLEHSQISQSKENKNDDSSSKNQ